MIPKIDIWNKQELSQLSDINESRYLCLWNNYISSFKALLLNSYQLDLFKATQKSDERCDQEE